MMDGFRVTGKRKKFIIAFFLMAAMGIMTACGNHKIDNGGESAEDDFIDFKKIQEINPEVFAWLYIPGTDIDYPILQSAIDDSYYETHLLSKEEGSGGCLYTEMANLMDMHDFNTVVHGHGAKKGELFFDLHRYEKNDILTGRQTFLDKNSMIYLYMPDNILTYEIFAVYPRKNSSLIRDYNFTDLADCEKFLEEVYQNAAIFVDGFEKVTPYHYILTLTTEDVDDSARQLNIIAVLLGDMNGKF